MRQLSMLISVWLLTLTQAGCGSSPCAVASLDYGLIGFSDIESQNIVLRKFQKGSDFSVKIDTVVVQADFKRKNDTLEISSIVYDGLLFSRYDYEVYFPNASSLYRVTNIVEEQREMKHSIFNPKKDGCINSITQLTINGQVITPIRYNRLYIEK